MKTRTFLIAALYLLAACAKDEGADGSNQPGNETGDETPQETSILPMNIQQLSVG